MEYQEAIWEYQTYTGCQEAEYKDDEAIMEHQEASM